MELENQDIFSLADMADMDISEVQEMRFESLPAGMFTFKVVSAEMESKDNKDNKPRGVIITKMEVVEVNKLLRNKGVDPESLVGKTHTEKHYLVPDEGPVKLADSVGRFKAFVKDLGFDDIPRTLNEVYAMMEGHVFEGQIVERPNPQDKTSPYASLKLAKRS